MSHEMFLGEDFIGKAKNIYQTIMIISQRARQIGEEQRKEMDNYLGSVEMMEKYENNEDEGMIEDNPVLHEPILQFEKPTILALREMISDKLSVVGQEEEVSDADAALEDEVAEVDVPFPAKLDLMSDDDEDEEDES